jgi:hypothetical protein
MSLSAVSLTSNLYTFHFGIPDFLHYHGDGFLVTK